VVSAFCEELTFHGYFVERIPDWFFQDFGDFIGTRVALGDYGASWCPLRAVYGGEAGASEALGLEPARSYSGGY